MFDYSDSEFANRTDLVTIVSTFIEFKTNEFHATKIKSNE